MLRTSNPLCKFGGIMLAIIILAFTYNLTVNLLVIGVAILFLLLSKVSPYKILKILAVLLLPAATVFLTGYFHSNTAVDSIGIISDNRIVNGIHLASRVFSFPLLGACFALTTDAQDFIRSLEQQTPLPPAFIYGFFAAFQLLPEIKAQYQTKRLAFANRGIRVSPISPKLLSLVLTTAVQWSDVLAGAMESRGFGTEEPRSHYKVISLVPTDFAVLIGFPLGVLLLSIFVG